MVALSDVISLMWPQWLVQATIVRWSMGFSLIIGLQRMVRYNHWTPKCSYAHNILWKAGRNFSVSCSCNGSLSAYTSIYSYLFNMPSHNITHRQDLIYSNITACFITLRDICMLLNLIIIDERGLWIHLDAIKYDSIYHNSVVVTDQRSR